MYSRNSFGSYYPVNSIIHKLNPVIKLFNFLIVIVLIILSNSIYLNSFILGLLIIMMLLSYVPFNYYFKTFWFLRYIYILIAFVCAYFRTSMQFCLILIMKIVIVVEYINLLSYTTSPHESEYGIEKFLSMFNILYLPVSKIAFKINSMLRYYPLMLSVEYNTLKAAASRGIDYYHSNIIKRVVIFLKLRSSVQRKTKDKSKEIKFASELRLFNIRRKRTIYRKNRVGFTDIFLLLFHLLFIYVYLSEMGIV